MHCWDQKGPIPLYEQEAAGIANCRSTDEIEALRYVLSRFFTRMDDGFYNHRMQKEIERAENISHARSEAGRRGYEAKSKQLPSKCLASAKQVHLSPPPSPSLSPTPEKQSLGVTSAEKQARATRLALLSCPEDWVLWCKANRPDLDPVQTWDRFSDYWKAVPGAKGRKLDWPATWRNWVRNERAGKGSSVDVAELVAELEREGK
jgi:uncharacterized protein YdaU (DUF1376 family)